MSDKLFSLIPMTMIEISAQQQIYTALKMPFLKKLAIMPDVHTGYSLPVGGVALLEGVVSPAYVGYDIGCGMCCIRTGLEFDDVIKDCEKTFKKLMSTVPCGVGLRGNTKEYSPFKSALGDKNLDQKVNAELFNQLGTLGGGNHFIEIGTDKNGNLTITIHSGSRNPGHSVGGHYMKLAKKNDTHLPGDFLDLSSDLGKAYLEDMNFMLQYALDNRKMMMCLILDALKLSDDFMDEMINENHNHAIVETKYGSNMVLHRKGATPADLDQLGVIPGNMRDGVYITRGLGNEEYLSSASHGAGRKGSRKWAKEKFELEAFEKSMKGIIANVSKHTLDECPFAYKDISDVIAAQEGIVVEVIDYIKPLINLKGI